MAKTSVKALQFASTGINAAKLSIEMFNRIDPINWKESVLIFNAQAWELLLKGVLLKKKESIYESDGKTISAEKALNKALHSLGIISKEDAKTISQIISLRNEATHSILPTVDEEILMHLIYFSSSAFNLLITNEFKSLKVKFEKNYLSVALGNHTFYSNKVEKLLKHSRKSNSEENKLLFLLDRGCEFVDDASNTQMRSKGDWDSKIRSLPKKSRIARHLSIYDYINTQDNVRLVPVHVMRGQSASINVFPSKNPAAPIMIKKSDPNKDFPHLTSDVAKIVGKNQNFIARMAIDLKLKTNEDYCYIHKTRKSETPKYSDKALNYMRDFLKQNSNYNPYK